MKKNLIALFVLTTFGSAAWADTQIQNKPQVWATPSISTLKRNNAQDYFVFTIALNQKDVSLVCDASSSAIQIESEGKSHTSGLKDSYIYAQIRVNDSAVCEDGLCAFDLDKKNIYGYYDNPITILVAESDDKRSYCTQENPQLKYKFAIENLVFAKEFATKYKADLVIDLVYLNKKTGQRSKIASAQIDMNQAVLNQALSHPIKNLGGRDSGTVSFLKK